MRMSRSKLFAVQVANFATEHKMSGRDVVELVMLAERVHSTGVSDCNSGTDRTDKAYSRAMDTLRDRAKTHGFDVRTHGLWPNLRRDGRDISIPSAK